MRGKSEYPAVHAGQHAPDGSDPIPGLDRFIRYDFENVGDWLYVETTEDAGSGPNGWGQEFIDSGGSGFHFDTTGVWQLDADGRIIVNGGERIDVSSVNDLNLNIGGGLDADITGAFEANAFQFDFDTADSNSWLYDSGWGLNFGQTGATGLIFNDGFLQFQTEDYFNMFADDYINLVTFAFHGGHAGDINISPAGQLYITPGNGFAGVIGGGVQWNVFGDVDIQLQAGDTFVLRDHSNNPKIQWTEGTNDLHIPTGGVVVADL